jgi:fucose permease
MAVNNNIKAGKSRAFIIRTVLLFIIIYATMFLFGLVENIKSVSFPLIKTEFGAAYDSQGGLVSMTWFGYVIFCLAGSLFLHRFGTKKAVLAGYVLVAVGAVATLAAPTFWAAGLALLVVNAGFGFFEVGANALGTVVFTARAALLMNLMHFFYGFGAILGPKTAGLMTDSLGFSWQQVYLVILIPVILVFFFILFTRFNGQNGQESAAEAPARVSFLSALRSPVVWLFCLTLGFMEVIEFGAANWGGLYLQDVYGLDPRVVGASFVSMFYILFTLSRLFSGLAIERIGYIRSLYFALAASIFLLFVGFSLGERGIWVLPFTGIFIAIMWPTIIAVAMQVFGPDAPAVTSVIITVSGAVNGVFQFVIGLTNQYIGPAWGYRSSLLYGVLALYLLYQLSRQIQQNGSGLAVSAVTPAAPPSSAA